MKVSSIYR